VLYPIISSCERGRPKRQVIGDKSKRESSRLTAVLAVVDFGVFGVDSAVNPTYTSARDETDELTYLSQTYQGQEDQGYRKRETTRRRETGQTCRAAAVECRNVVRKYPRAATEGWMR